MFTSNACQDSEEEDSFIDAGDLEDEDEESEQDTNESDLCESSAEEDTDLDEEAFPFQDLFAEDY